MGEGVECSGESLFLRPPRGYRLMPPPHMKSTGAEGCVCRGVRLLWLPADLQHYRGPEGVWGGSDGQGLQGV
eukprot:2665571-Pyramimonas_sp.AAC.1